MHPNYQLTDVAIVLCFQLCSAHYTTLQAKNSRRSTSAINPICMENMDDSCYKHREAILLPRINTLVVMVHKGGQSEVHDVCIVCTAVYQTTPVRLKRYQTMKKSSLYISLAVIELWFSQGI